MSDHARARIEELINAIHAVIEDFDDLHPSDIFIAVMFIVAEMVEQSTDKNRAVELATDMMQRGIKEEH